MTQLKLIPTLKLKSHFDMIPLDLRSPVRQHTGHAQVFAAVRLPTTNPGAATRKLGCDTRRDMSFINNILFIDYLMQTIVAENRRLREPELSVVEQQAPATTLPLTDLIVYSLEQYDKWRTLLLCGDSALRDTGEIVVHGALYNRLIEVRAVEGGQSSASRLVIQRVTPCEADGTNPPLYFDTQYHAGGLADELLRATHVKAFLHRFNQSAAAVFALLLHAACRAYGVEWHRDHPDYLFDDRPAHITTPEDIDIWQNGYVAPAVDALLRMRTTRRDILTAEYARREAQMDCLIRSMHREGFAPSSLLAAPARVKYKYLCRAQDSVRVLSNYSRSKSYRGWEFYAWFADMACESLGIGGSDNRPIARYTAGMTWMAGQKLVNGEPAPPVPEVVPIGCGGIHPFVNKNKMARSVMRTVCQGYDTTEFTTKTVDDLWDSFEALRELDYADGDDGFNH